MNKLVLISLLIVTTKISWSQSYQSIFGKDSTTWIIEWTNDFSTDGAFSIIEDSVYCNSHTYKVIGGPGRGLALIREDTSTGKVWTVDLLCSIYNTDSIEQLVADMSLQVGDSFSISMSDIGASNPSDTFIVVDSVYYVQGQKRIRFKFPLSVYPGLYTEPITFIEGIGPNYSLLWKVGYHCSGFTDKYLICVYKDGVQADYTNIRFNGQCNPVFAGVTDIGINKIIIYPDPAEDYLNITGVENARTTGIITNAMGQQVGQYSLTNNSNRIPLENLPAGYYQITFYVDGLRVDSGKFIKVN